MTFAVFNVLHTCFVFTMQCEQLVDQHAVCGFVSSTDVVDLANIAFFQNQMHAGAVVVYVQPVALVQAIAVQRNLLAIQQVGGKQRNCFLWVLVRTKVIGATCNGYRQAMSCVI